MENPHWSRLVLRDLLPCERSHTEPEDEHEEEGAVETMHYGLTVRSIPHSPDLFRGMDVEKLGMKE